MKKIKILSLVLPGLIAVMLFAGCGKDSSTGPENINNAPIPNFTVTPDSGTVNTEFIFDASSSSDAEDSLSALKVRFDFDGDGNFDTDWNAEKTATHKYESAGTYNAKLEVKDSGDSVSEKIKAVVVNETSNIAPTADFTVNPESGDVNTEFTFDASSSSDVEDSLSALKVRFDFDGDGNFDTDWTAEKTAIHKYDSAGTYNAKLEVKDSGDSVSEKIKAVVVNETSNIAPTADFTVNPESGDINTEFTFDASSSSDVEDSLSALKVRFDFDGDGNFDTDWTAEKTATHKYDSAGTYNAKLEVKDSGDSISEKIKAVVVNEISNTAPTADFTVNPESGNVNTEFTFDASSSFDAEDETDDLQVRFDFDGDGNFDTDWTADKIFNHNYSSPATYSVKLEVKDSGDLVSETVKEVPVSENNTPENMIFVEGGSFEMGFAGFSFDEEPVHTVNLQDFYIGKYEVTNAEYVVFLNDQGNQVNGQYCLNTEDDRCHIYEENGQFTVKEGKENYPVIFVSWYGAKAYAEWIGGRLPSESEWEYAARGGSQSQGYTYSGSNNLTDVAWYYDNSFNSDNNLEDGRGTHPVGELAENELGICDMSGNVWEWCEDKWHNDYNGAPSDGSAWIEGGSDPRIIRGGSWGAFSSMCRVFYRAGFYPEVNPDANSFHDYGFRIVIDID